MSEIVEQLVVSRRRFLWFREDVYGVVITEGGHGRYRWEAKWGTEPSSKVAVVSLVAGFTSQGGAVMDATVFFAGLGCKVRPA